MFKTIHIAIPVQDLDASRAFFVQLFDATVIVSDHARRRCTVVYDRFEFSLFELPGFAWRPRELGPFHFGHEVGTREEVDAIYRRAMTHGYSIKCQPFDRDDGDYAFFLTDPDGVVFEFFFGGHKSVRQG